MAVNGGKRQVASFKYEINKSLEAQRINLLSAVAKQ
jgi:hypothetical protein